MAGRRTVGLVALWALWPALARGQPSAEPPSGQPAPALEAGGPRATWEDFRAIWARRGAALARADLARADQHLIELLALKGRSGWPDVFPLAAALRHEAEQGADRGDTRRALMYAVVAAALAPHDAASHWSLARLRLRHDWTDLGHAAQACARAIGTYAHDWRMRTLALANLVPWALEVGLLFSLLLLGLLLWRHRRNLLHDLHHLLPRGATPFQVAIVALVVLLAPILLHAGILWYLMLLAAAVWWSLRSVERVTVSLVVLTWAGAALVLPLLLGPLTAPSGGGWDRYFAAADPSASALDNRLLAAEREWRGGRIERQVSGHDLYVAGLRALRAGHLPGLGPGQTLAHARALLGQAAERLPWSAEIQHALGVAYQRGGDHDSARRAYEAALKASPSFAPAAVNLHRLSQGSDAAAEAEAALAAASPRAVAAYQEAASLYGPSFLALPGPTAQVFEAASPAQRAARHIVADQIWRWLSIGSRALFVGGSLGLWLALLLIAVATGGARRSATCPRCGQPLCQRCSPDLPDHSQCGRCHHAFVLREGVESRVRIDQEVAIQRYHARRDRTLLVLGLLLPGGAQLLQGRAVGGPLLLLFAAGLVTLLQGLAIIPDVIPLDGGGHLPRLGAAGGMLALAYLVSWFERSRASQEG